jgi:hypothetical protein
MPLNSSGRINLGGSTAATDVAAQLGLPATATITMNDAAVRTLAGKTAAGSTITFADFYGKPPAPAVTPAPTPAPAVTPAPTPAPAVTPAPTPAPAVTPAPTPAPAVTPAPTPAPAVTPAPTPAPAVTPAPTPAPAVTPAPTPAPAVTPAPTPAPAAIECICWTVYNEGSGPGNYGYIRCSDGNTVNAPIPAFATRNICVQINTEPYENTGLLTFVMCGDICTANGDCTTC